MGFKQLRNDDGTEKTQPLYVRFRDSITGQIIGEESEAFNVMEDEFSWKTPPASLDTKAILDFSYNKEDWQHILLDAGKNYSFTYYNAPKIGSVTPTFGPVKSPNGETIDIKG